MEVWDKQLVERRHCGTEIIILLLDTSKMVNY